MNIKEVKLYNLFYNWLAISLILVFFIIIVGGLTRLTNSGLSIIEWELFRGIIPPLNDITWQSYFEKYKTIPQYKLLNYSMTLNEFKIIFYWEYFLRFLARIIGIFFLLPLILFYYSKKIDFFHIRTCFFISLLILTQGIVGWYMVKSGLVYNITVSHYRLALHLILALLIISSIFWVLKNILSNKKKIFFKLKKNYFPFQFLIIIIFIQIVFGAFVSGLDAGMIYQTWPLMGNSFFPNDFHLNSFKDLFDFHNHSLIQFYHRNLAYFIFFYGILLTIFVYREKKSKLYKALKIFLTILSIQVILGVVTLVSDLNIFLASAHQVAGVLLVFSALNLYYLNVK